MRFVASFALAVALALPPAARAAEPDLAFGAFQRGYFITAFQLATKRAADNADIKAMTLLGELYANGLGVPQDDRKAAEWYKLAAAAKLGQPLAAYDLALLYIEGQLFPQDFVRAAALLRTAATAGNADAQYALGTFYKEGRGVEKDMHEATRLWAQAALADNTDAQVEYAIALYNGDGVEKNQPIAAGLFHQAALHGSAIAQDRLARILASGQGVPANALDAAKWHLISLAGGESDLELDGFVDKLDLAARAAAEKAAKPWIEAINSARQAKEKAAPAAGAPQQGKP
jgi:uncharacterized protein